MVNLAGGSPNLDSTGFAKKPTNFPQNPCFKKNKTSSACVSLQAIHARLQGFPTSGTALNTFTLPLGRVGFPARLAFRFFMVWVWSSGSFKAPRFGCFPFLPPRFGNHCHATWGCVSVLRGLYGSFIPRLCLFVFFHFLPFRFSLPFRFCLISPFKQQQVDLGPSLFQAA